MLAKALASATAAAPKTYVEDVFSTWLYTGNGSTQTITNGIDLSGKGGLVWIKGRSVAYSNYLTDTVRGPNKNLFSDSTLAEQNDTNSITAFNSNGWSMDAESGINASSQTYASWTFRKAAKFFDVVTYTGNGAESRNISHSLGATPGCIIIKCLSSSAGWAVWHRNNGTAPLNLGLNATWGYGAVIYSGFPQSATSSTFNVDNVSNDINSVSYHCNLNNETYVAYLFAHDAGSFGDSGNDNVISCGSYVGNGSTTGPTVAIGWEPQWLLIKNASTAGSFWSIFDNMRGMVANGNAADDARLMPHAASAESLVSAVSPSSTGFSLTTNSADYNELNSTYIYIAIRRGPMKKPTDATKVFAVDLGLDAGTSSTPSATAGFPVDMGIITSRTSADNRFITSRLTAGNVMYTEGTFAESANSIWSFSYQNGFAAFGAANADRFAWMFRRAPGFFDVVAYTGTGSATTVSHNLGVVPELMIAKRRNDVASWPVYAASLGTGIGTGLRLNTIDSSVYNNGDKFYQTPTSSSFFVGTSADVNLSGSTYITYLFATCPGVSKVGSYTGSGTTKQIDCGFTAGARFVLIKRTDSTGDWYVWDTARGIISGNDPYLLINSSAAEVTGTDYIDPLNSGFEISSTAPAAINANGGSFIFLAIA